MARKSLTDFIKENRNELDLCIRRVSNCRLNDAERRMWILNDSGLYSWAKSDGVNI